MEYVEHTFGPGETIQAVIRKHNRQNMPDDIKIALTIEYLNLNDISTPKVGDKCKIPLYEFKNEKQVILKSEPVLEPIPDPPLGIEEIKTTKEILVPAEILSFPIEIIEPTRSKRDDRSAMLRRQKRRELARAKRDGIPYVIESAPEPPTPIPVPSTKEVETEKRKINKTPMSKPSPKIKSKLERRRRKLQVDPVVETVKVIDTPPSAKEKKALKKERPQKVYRALRKRRR